MLCLRSILGMAVPNYPWRQIDICPCPYPRVKLDGVEPSLYTNRHYDSVLHLNKSSTFIPTRNQLSSIPCTHQSRLLLRIQLRFREYYTQTGLEPVVDRTSVARHRALAWVKLVGFEPTPTSCVATRSSSELELDLSSSVQTESGHRLFPATHHYR